jgi:hypothetical protein
MDNMAETIETEKTPTVFISYSWDNPKHKEWVLNLADKLIRDGGVDVKLDRYDLNAGKRMTHFMENAVGKVDKVLMIMTPNYKEKAENRTGGVGYEYSMVTQELYEKQDTGKFIPIRRIGSNDECAPKFLKSYISHDMTNDATFDKDFHGLLRIIYDEPEIKRPALGKRPTFISKETKNIVTSSIDDKANFETDVRINGYAKWTIDIHLASLHDQNGANLFKLLTSNIIIDEETQFPLPQILFDKFKASHHPEIIYDYKLHSNNLSGHKEQEKLKIETGLLHYEYAEYGNIEPILLYITQPFSTLFYLLVIINSVHKQLKRTVDLSINIKFISDKRTLLNSQFSPFTYPKHYNFQTMGIPDGRAEKFFNLSSISNNSIFNLFEKIYEVFIDENPKSLHPFVTIDREYFNLITNKYLGIKPSTITFGRNVSRNSYD